MGRLIDADALREQISKDPREVFTKHQVWLFASEHNKTVPTVEAIPKDHVYKAIQEMMKYEHEGLINISLVRLDEILKKCGVSEDGNDEFDDSMSDWQGEDRWNQTS